MIFLVIIAAGLSVKEYACFLVNSENIVGQDLVDLLNSFLWKISIFVFITAGLVHYFTVKRILKPIKQLSSAAEKIKKGEKPQKIQTLASGELKDLIDNFNSMSETINSVQEQREEMLRDIAHELRTPLTNINGYLEALQNNVIDGNPELFGSLLEESRRITRIVELITELNSWNNGNFFIDKQFDKLRIDNVLNEALTAFSLKIQEKFSKTNFQIHDSIVIGNKDGLMQVFTNILQNILDYNTGNDLTINGTTENNKYFITFTHLGQYIDPEKREKIFARFYRLEESRTTKSEGAGLGLSIAKSIITAHRGKIGLQTDGNCHTFWIEIPITHK